MPTEEARVFVALGKLEERIAGLSDKIDGIDQRSTAEHRTVHDIVVATSESVRNLTRMVEDMKPPVEDYRLKAAAIHEAVELAGDYKEQRAEDRGAEKYRSWLYGIAASVGGLIAILFSKLIDYLLARPHIPVIAIIILTITIVMSGHALGHGFVSPMRS